MININISFKKIHSLLILIFLFFFFIFNSAYSEHTKIGSITELYGNAGASQEDADLIAHFVAGVSDEVVNTIMEEVSKTSTDDKQTLSAKVLKAIVDSDSGKIDIINDDVKDTMIKQTIVSAQNQQEGTGVQQDQDMTSIISDIIVNTNTETGSKMMEEVNNSTTADSNLSLDVFSDLAKQENFEEKLDTLSEEAVNNMITKAVDNADEQDTETISDILQNSETSITSKIIDTATNSEENKNVVTDALVDVAKEDPDKVKEILVESEKDTTTTNTDENKTKIYGAGGFGLTSPYHHKDTGTPYNPAGFDKDGNIETDAGGFSVRSPYHHKNTGTPYNPAGFDKDGKIETDAGGFSVKSPYHHKNTGTPYNPAGFEKDGNIETDAGGFSVKSPYHHKDTGTPYNPAGFDKDGNIETGAGGFSLTSPYHHKDTGTPYNPAGFDKDGNIETDAGGFSVTSPYHHKNTGTPYNPAGFDKYGNINPASGSDPNWVTEPTFSESYTTADTISISASATSSPAPNGIKYSATDLPPGVDIMSTGIISGTPTTAGTYTGEIIATDKVNVARQITSAFSFTVTEAGGPYDANGFNAAGYHRNGTIYDDEDYDIDGYNRNGFNAADEYDPLYDENVSRA